MKKIIISEFIDESALTYLTQELAQEPYTFHYDKTLGEHRKELLEHMADCAALIVRNKTQVDNALIAQAPHLRVVGRLGVGLDNIALKTCANRSITVIPATGANAVSVAEYVILASLCLLRPVLAATAELVNGQWARERWINSELAERTLGLVGFGVIARKVAVKAAPLFKRILAYDPALAADHPVWTAHNVLPQKSLSALLSASDVISLHLPLTPATRGLFTSERLKEMRPNAILINTARGGMIDEAALWEALRQKKLAGAAMDVFATEPFNPSPELKKTLASLPNLMLTPHIAGVTLEGNRRISLMIAEKVLHALTH